MDYRQKEKLMKISELDDEGEGIDLEEAMNVLSTNESRFEEQKISGGGGRQKTSPRKDDKNIYEISFGDS